MSKNNHAVVRIKSEDPKLIDLVRVKLSELNQDDKYKVVSGFVETDKDGINYFLYINVIVANEGGKH